MSLTKFSDRRWPYSLALCLPFVLLFLPLAGCSRAPGPSAGEQAAVAAGEGLDRARNERTLNQLEQFRTALARYAIDHDGLFPEGSSLSGISGELAPGYTPIVAAEDAWGHTMTYASDGRTYSVVSAGPDGTSGTGDDIALRDGSITAGAVP